MFNSKFVYYVRLELVRVLVWKCLMLLQFFRPYRRTIEDTEGMRSCILSAKEPLIVQCNLTFSTMYLHKMI